MLKCERGEPGANLPRLLRGYTTGVADGGRESPWNPTFRKNKSVLCVGVGLAAARGRGVAKLVRKFHAY